jgi:hypothetical protein
MFSKFDLNSVRHKYPDTIAATGMFGNQMTSTPRDNMMAMNVNTIFAVVLVMPYDVILSPRFFAAYMPVMVSQKISKHMNIRTSDMGAKNIARNVANLIV